MKYRKWQLQTAENKFSELVNEAQKEELELVTKDGRAAVYVIDCETFDRMRGKSRADKKQVLFRRPHKDVEPIEINPVDPGSVKNYDENMNQSDRIPSIINQGNLTLSLLELPCTLVGNRGRISTVCLFDSGASHSVIRRVTAERITRLEPLPKPIAFETAAEGDFITSDFLVFLEFFLEDAPRQFTDAFMVLDTLSEDLIIGATTMRKWQIKLDFDSEKVVYDRKMHRLRI